MSGTIQGERAPPEVTTRRRFTRNQMIALYVLATGGVITFIFWRNAAKEPYEPAPPNPQTSIRQLARPEILEPPRPAPALPVAMPAPPPPPIFMPPVQPLLTPQAGPTMRRTRMLSFAPPPASPTPPAAAPATPVTPPGTTVSFPSRTIEGGRAGRALDQTYLLMPGIYRCILDTAVLSEQSGPFMCHTSQHIYSPTGVLLMERGTQVVGQYQANVRQGQTRIPALSVAAYTPNGVPVPLGAAMADGLGRVGLDGERDTHFWDRFGGATLLMLSQGAISAATAALQNGSGNQTVNLGGGSFAVQSAITETLRATINIQPTITKHQGEEVAFFVTAPISFADAYVVVPNR